jgi:hypothetical protein
MADGRLHAAFATSTEVRAALSRLGQDGSCARPLLACVLATT